MVHSSLSISSRVAAAASSPPPNSPWVDGTVTGLVIASLFCCPRALTSRVARELSIPFSAPDGARTPAFAAGGEVTDGAGGRTVLAATGSLAVTGAVTGLGCRGTTGAGWNSWCAGTP